MHYMPGNINTRNINILDVVVDNGFNIALYKNTIYIVQKPYINHSSIDHGYADL